MQLLTDNELTLLQSNFSRLLSENKDLRAICRIALGCFYMDSKGYWRAGPLADPSTKEGTGGLLQMLMEATR